MLKPEQQTLQGHCRDGSDCRYAHDETELPAAVDADLGEEEGLLPCLFAEFGRLGNF